MQKTTIFVEVIQKLTNFVISGEREQLVIVLGTKLHTLQRWHTAVPPPAPPPRHRDGVAYPVTMQPKKGLLTGRQWGPPIIHATMLRRRGRTAPATC